MKFIPIVLLMLMSISVRSQESETTINPVTFHENIANAVDNKLYDSLKTTFEGFFSTLGESWESDYWYNNDYKLFKKPFAYLLLPLVTRSGNYTPFVMSIESKGQSEYLAKIAYMQCDSPASITKILYVGIRKDGVDQYKLCNPLDYLTKKWNRYTVGSLEYVVNPNKIFNNSEATKMDSFNVAMSHYFKLPIISVKYYSCGFLPDFWYVQGEDKESMTGYYESSTGGKAAVEDKIIYSGNNTEYYPHELVHIYVQQLLKDYDNNNFSVLALEGIPTYLGGSSERSLYYHLKKVAKYVDSNNINNIKTLREAKYRISTEGVDTQVDYVIGGLIAMLIDKKSGIKGITELSNSHNDDEVFKLLSETYKIKQKKIDDFLFNEINKYK